MPTSKKHSGKQIASKKVAMVGDAHVPIKNPCAEISLDCETSGIINISNLEDSIAKMQANFGQPSKFYMDPIAMRGFMGISGEIHPEFSGTPWAEEWIVWDKERPIASLHSVLEKLGALRGMDEIDHKKVIANARNFLDEDEQKKIFMWDSFNSGGFLQPKQKNKKVK